MGILREAIWLCLLLGIASQTAQASWWITAPPTEFFAPDINVTSSVPLPRVPPSPYGVISQICPQADGTPYAVAGFPGTPYIQRPFSNAYRQPPRPQPTAVTCRTGDTSPSHCIKAFEIDVKSEQLRVFDSALPGCQAKPGTWFMTYNGSCPGPTITASVGHEVLVRFNNNITGPKFDVTYPPCDAPGRTGRPLAIHLHGSASLAPYDGWAEDNICKGESKDYIYPNQRPTTGWYHDHALHITLDNAYHGLAGMYIMSNKVKDGGCGEPFNLEDIEERVMIMRDAVLDSECQLYYDFAGPHNKNLYGDINLINGIPWPEMQLEPKWYRFRFLNAATSRPFLLKFKNEFGLDVGPNVCRMIAADGGYREDALLFPPEGLLMGVAERYEVVCNFEGFRGKQLFLWNGFNPRMQKEVPYFCHSHLLALLTVSTTTSVPNPPVVDETLVPPSPSAIKKVLSPADIVTARQLIAQQRPTRTFEFGRSNGEWVINGQTWDTAKIAAADVGQNTWEVWHFKTGGGWFHPIHMHLVDFFIMQRGNKCIECIDGLFGYERNVPKDMLYLGPSQDLYVLVRFGAHRGSYMFHCHNLDHEDHDMMRAWTAVGGTGQDNLPTANPATTLPINQVAGVIYNNYAYNDPRTAVASARPTATWPKVDATYIQQVVDMNLYRIFYPNSTDIPGLQKDQNPWYASVCQQLQA